MLGGIRERNSRGTEGTERKTRGTERKRDFSRRNPVAYAHRQRIVALWAKIQTAGSLREIHYRELPELWQGLLPALY